MKGLDSCERCGDMVAYEHEEDHTIKEGETVVLVETNPKNKGNCIKETDLYHPDCYREKIKEEIKEEAEEELREEIKEELKEKSNKLTEM